MSSQTVSSPVCLNTSSEIANPHVLQNRQAFPIRIHYLESYGTTFRSEEFLRYFRRSVALKRSLGSFFFGKDCVLEWFTEGFFHKYQGQENNVVFLRVWRHFEFKLL
ncbi:hypothetical protein NDU88_005965 [Pleurodeles waltl]|uniref:Uncharacterized protein n=1 Tax=Pleurodeles waltl TaxID=8319 RepID=A0AAV7UJJ3_PLEWA|nr:hypothetical protein NDU88_005965 [Pleurodeles waltl]